MAAAPRASAQAKLSWRQHDAPVPNQYVLPVVQPMEQLRTYKVFEPLLELLAVVALGNAVLYPPALSKI